MKKTNQPSGKNISRSISLHKTNFEDYITKYAQTNSLAMSGEVWERALAAAKRLDYTGDRDAQPRMQLIPSQPTFVRRLLRRLQRRRPQGIHLSEPTDIQAFLKLAPEAAATVSEISWGALRNGFGTWVMAILRPGGQQIGSRPTPRRLRDTPGWELLAARRLLSRKALYVRAHLLHHDLGGAGVDYNEAILTAAARGDFGANHANWVHRYLVEGTLLWAYENMHGVFGTPTISEIYYEVVADYSREPREGTQELQQIALAYKKAAKLVQGKLVAEGGRKEPIFLRSQQVMSELALNQVSPYIEDAMSAVAAEMGENWRDVYERLIANQQLWQFEDANVPKALRIRYSWVERGILSKRHEETVSIVLPTSLSAKFQV